MGGGVHDSYTFQCGLVGYFTSPDIDTRQKGPTTFSVSSERHWQRGVYGIAKVPKRSCRSGIRTRPGTARSPIQANAFIHSATRPPRSQLLLRFLISYLSITDNQFGFNNGLSTDHCTCTSNKEPCRNRCR